MLIAFWGADRKCRTTSNMLAVKTLMEIFVLKRKEHADISFVDCGYRKDERTKRILKHANLVVVNLIQEQSILDSFFLYDIHIAEQIEKIVFLIGNYCNETGFGKTEIVCRYRAAPERLGIIPCNSEFEQAVKNGRVGQYIRACFSQPVSERNRCFLQELQRFLFLLLRSMDQYAALDHSKIKVPEKRGRKDKWNR